MEWEIYHQIEKAEIIIDEEADKVTLQCIVPESAEHFQKLLDNATQATLDFDGGDVEGVSVIGFQLRNANGEFYLGLRKPDWELLLEQPDAIVFQYGEGEKQWFETTFLNWVFDQFVDEAIERYNKGEKNPFITDMIEVFAEED